MREERKLEVGVLLYPGVEILEIAGPAEVFAAAKGFTTVGIGLSEKPVLSRGNLKLVPEYTTHHCPHLDVLVVPGGAVKELQQDEELIRWLQSMTIRTTILMSVCTGAYLLATAGLLDGRSYTSSSQGLEELPGVVKGGRAVANVRYVDSGNIITTAGPSSGIDGALHVVKRMEGVALAESVAGFLEYPLWTGPSGSDADRAAAQKNRGATRRNSENTAWLGNK